MADVIDLKALFKKVAMAVIGCLEYKAIFEGRKSQSPDPEDIPLTRHWHRFLSSKLYSMGNITYSNPTPSEQFSCA